MLNFIADILLQTLQANTVSHISDTVYAQHVSHTFARTTSKWTTHSVLPCRLQFT